MSDTETGQLERTLAHAVAAATALAGVPTRTRAIALVAAAAAIDGAAGELVEIAARETGLATPRLQGELRRTSLQLRLFAEVAADASFLDVRMDEADADYVLGARPDLRRYLAPVGPVLNFAASNFPFAFSVAGGDTAAALAAGNPVIVKAHPGHPETSDRTAEVVAAALTDAGLPLESLQVVHGVDAGVTLLQDRRIRAASFTGSQTAGRRLAEIAAARSDPIPFFGELGSVNPAIVTPAAAAIRAESIADGFVASVSGSAGQLCTKPGFLFVPSRSSALIERVAAAAGAVAEQRLLHPGITAGYRQRQRAVLGSGAVSVIVDGEVREDDNGFGWATPTLVQTSLAQLRAAGGEVLDETFGPFSVIVTYDDLADVTAAFGELFPGLLAAGLHAEPDEPQGPLTALVAELSRHAGRVLLNGWPTGVAVTPAMQHGGPYPAATQPTTSVGTASITRFLRGVTFQDVPDALLPPPLRDANPWGVPQHRSPAGASRSWGSLHGVDAVG